MMISAASLGSGAMATIAGLVTHENLVLERYYGAAITGGFGLLPATAALAMAYKLLRDISY